MTQNVETTVKETTKAAEESETNTEAMVSAVDEEITAIRMAYLDETAAKASEDMLNQNFEACLNAFDGAFYRQ